MDEDLKKKWVKALRSGRYKQTKQQLRRDEGYGRTTPAYCCLGVLCQVMGVPYSKSDAAYLFKFEDEFGERREELEQGQLPDEVAKQLGFTKKVTNEGVRVTLQNKLIDMNDDKQKSFKDIADYIEKVKI